MMRKTLATLVTGYLLLAGSPSEAQEPPSTPAVTATATQFQPSHVALRVADLDESVAWWTDVFGAREVRRSQVPAIAEGAEIAFLHVSGGFHVELIGGGEPVDAGPPEDIAGDYGEAGYKHVGFVVDDMERVLAEMARKGVRPDYRTTREDYGVHIALIREPSGRYVELYAPITAEDAR